MNFYTFALAVVVWIICAYNDNLAMASLVTIALLVAVDSEQKPKNDNLDIDVSFPTGIESPTKGPVFPDPEFVDNNHVHFLEEPTEVGVFTFDRKTLTWVPVGTIEYKEGQKPELVATVVHD